MGESRPPCAEQHLARAVAAERRREMGGGDGNPPRSPAISVTPAGRIRSHRGIRTDRLRIAIDPDLNPGLGAENGRDEQKREEERSHGDDLRAGGMTLGAGRMGSAGDPGHPTPRPSVWFPDPTVIPVPVSTEYRKHNASRPAR